MANKLHISQLPPRSDGVCQRFKDYALLDRRTFDAVTGGLKGNELNFTLLKQGELVSGTQLQNGYDNTHEFNPRNASNPHNAHSRRGPDVPRPKQKLRDDLEMEFASKFRPRPV
ncbi:MAG: hypothetical protein AB7I18_00195 [Candidatus Berkiella sp.]